MIINQNLSGLRLNARKKVITFLPATQATPVPSPSPSVSHTTPWFCVREEMKPSPHAPTEDRGFVSEKRWNLPPPRRHKTDTRIQFVSEKGGGDSPPRSDRNLRICSYKTVVPSRKQRSRVQTGQSGVQTGQSRVQTGQVQSPKNVPLVAQRF